MRKVCLILLLFAFLSAVPFPAYAAKIITNDDLDRTVPSRCSGRDEDVYYEQEQNNSYEPVSNKVIRAQKDNFERYYKPILGEDFRIELLGVKWNYPVDEEEVNQNDENNDEEVNYEDNNQKPYTREAADYGYFDTLRDNDENQEEQQDEEQQDQPQEE